VDRGLTAEGGPNEFGLPTFVSRRFVDASDGSAGFGQGPAPDHEIARQGGVKPVAGFGRAGTDIGPHAHAQPRARGNGLGCGDQRQQSEYTSDLD